MPRYPISQLVVALLGAEDQLREPAYHARSRADCYHTIPPSKPAGPTRTPSFAGFYLRMHRHSHFRYRQCRGMAYAYSLSCLRFCARSPGCGVRDWKPSHCKSRQWYRHELPHQWPA
ncbi:hypothetical protein PsYK624_049310 [Phanerochaete sordida]|uniref:Uncharacterized protein n=1 Tax=Phanerochaete sordida TaxID=48140 RepID=A0A9P3G6P9_9APHY|nr:hypothetical protein PsYK624_049310 [Phanerochaete sordida]